MAYSAIVKVSYKHKVTDANGKVSTKKYVVKKPCDFVESPAESVALDGETETVALINEARKTRFSKGLRARLEAKVTGGDAPTSNVEDYSDLLDDDDDE